MDHAWKRHSTISDQPDRCSIAVGRIRHRMAHHFEHAVGRDDDDLHHLRFSSHVRSVAVRRVWADRYNRKVLIAAADAGIALATLVVAVLFMTGHNAIWMLFVASAIRSSAELCRTTVSAVFLSWCRLTG